MSEIINENENVSMNIIREGRINLQIVNQNMNKNSQTLNLNKLANGREFGKDITNALKENKKPLETKISNNSKQIKISEFKNVKFIFNM